MSRTLSPDLRDTWTKKLAESGFQDIEDKKGNLKQPDRRSIAFDNRDLIRDFFIRLDHFLTENKDIPILHWQVLTLYSEGLYIPKICNLVGKGRTFVCKVILYYRNLLTGKFCCSMVYMRSRDQIPHLHRVKLGNNDR